MAGFDIRFRRKREIADKIARIEISISGLERLVADNRIAIIQNGKIDNAVFQRIKADYEVCYQEFDEFQKAFGQDLPSKSGARFQDCKKRVNNLHKEILEIQEALEKYLAGKGPRGLKVDLKQVKDVLYITTAIITISGAVIAAAEAVYPEVSDVVSNVEKILFPAGGHSGSHSGNHSTHPANHPNSPTHSNHSSGSSHSGGLGFGGSGDDGIGGDYYHPHEEIDIHDRDHHHHHK